MPALKISSIHFVGFWTTKSISGPAFIFYPPLFFEEK